MRKKALILSLLLVSLLLIGCSSNSDNNDDNEKIVEMENQLSGMSKQINIIKEENELIKETLMNIQEMLTLSQAPSQNNVSQNNNGDKNDCMIEGEISNPSVGPQYYKPCCNGLESFNRRPDMDGAGSVCYNNSKGKPNCQKIGTNNEGRYYSDGTLLKLDNQCNSFSL